MKLTNRLLKTPYVSLLTGLTLIACIVPSATARKQSSPATTQLATVIGHVELQGAPATRMFLQAQGGKRYLYIDQGTQQGFTIVDVTKPDQLRVVKHEATGNVQIVNGDLALAEAPDKDSRTVARSQPAPAESVRVLDLSDPSNPRTVQTFSGVTSMLPDQARNLVYIANGEGLWVLMQKKKQRQLPVCDSSAAMASNPDCQ